MTELVFTYGMLLDPDGFLRTLCSPPARALVPGRALALGGLADAPLKSGGAVWGGAWEVDWDVLETLDRFEGVPDLYRRVETKAVLLGAMGWRVECWIYEMTARTRRSQIGLTPSEAYVASIRRGYEWLGLPMEAFERARASG